jgi:hypothetical protein
MSTVSKLEVVKCLAAQPKDLMLLLELSYTTLEKLVFILENSEFKYDSTKSEESEVAKWLTETFFPNLLSILDEFSGENHA